MKNRFIKKQLNRLLKTIILMGLSFIFTSHANAQSDIDVPMDELAQETVYPVFDHLASVKNRNVATEDRFDLGLFGGYALTEPIYNTTKFGFALNYHINELHSLGALFSLNSTGLSRDGDALRGQGLDFNRAPKPKSTILMDYNYKPYYGKLSVTKNSVINTTIYGSAAAGLIAYEHKSYPTVALGLGERFYFTSRFSLKIDLRLFIHQAPVPFKAGALRPEATPVPDPIPSADSFDERISYTTNLEAGLNYLF